MLQSLGDFGWYYGDLFLEKPQGKVLSYTGIYRFMNNPDAVFGDMWLYGIAAVTYR